MTATARPSTNGANASPTEHVESRPVTVPDFLSARARGQRLALLDAAGVDGLLVGDSLGMVVQGQPDSLAVTLDEMIYHTRLVKRGARRSLIVTDMPFMTFQVSPEQAVENARRI